MARIMWEYRLFDRVERWKLLLSDYALLILNTPIRIHPDHLKPIWNQALVRVCVDGGAGRWLKYVEKHQLDCGGKSLPDLVTGDLDSASGDHLKILREAGVRIIPTPDQDHTDFTKALRELASSSHHTVKSVVVLVESSGGRLDHTFSNLNTLSRSSELFGGKDVNVYLLGRSSATWLLRPGLHKIHVPDWVHSYPCGILPFAPVTSSIKTSGLRWNLDGESIEFGGLISSSNQFSGEEVVSIETNAPLIWTMSIDEEEETSAHL